MRLPTTTAAALIGLLALSFTARAAEPPAQQFHVAKTHDGKPFDYQIKPLSEGQGYRVFRLTYPSAIVTPLAQNNTIPTDYYLPTGVEPGAAVKRPAVVCIHILHGNFELERITCSVLASRGIAAAMIRLPYYAERGTDDGPRLLLKQPKLFLQALDQGVEDVRRTLDLLAARPEVDANALGLVGISLGGISTAVIAPQDERVARAALILAGGDLDYIIQHAQETREIAARLKELAPPERAELQAALRRQDPLQYAAKLRDRARQGRVLMINATDDKVIDPKCTRKLAEALGMADRVHWLEGLGHYTAIAALPQVLDEVAGFFAQDLSAAARPVAARPTSTNPLQVVAALMRQASTVLGNPPAQGRGHLLDVKGAVRQKDGKPVEFVVRFVVGSRNRFRLEANVPEVGMLATGCNDRPWMLAAGKKLFEGREPIQSEPLALASPQHLMKLKLAAGTLAGMAMSPQILEQLVVFRDGGDQSAPAIELNTRDGRKRSGTLRLQSDRRTPKQLKLKVDGVEVDVDFRVWQVDTVIPDELLAPPEHVSVEQVDTSDLLRMYAAVFNFAMEKMQ